MHRYCFGQNLKDMSVFLVDDGSTDGCAEICDEKCKDPNVLVIHKKNQGLSDARNSALEITDSEYVTFVDGDDYLCNPNAYSKVISVLQSTKCDMAYFWYIPFVDGEIPQMPLKMCSDEISVMNHNESVSFFLSKSLTMYGAVQWNKIFKYSLFYGVRYDSNSYCEDLRIMPDIIRKINSSVIADVCAVCYRMRREGAITQQIKPKLLFDRAISVLKTRNFAIECGNEKTLPVLNTALLELSMSAYYTAWRGVSNETTYTKKQYMMRIKNILKDKSFMDKTTISNQKYRIGVRLFNISPYLFLVYNRMFKAFGL